MFRFLNFIIISNALSYVAVLYLDDKYNAFGIQSLSDVAFFMALVLWAVAGVLHFLTRSSRSVFANDAADSISMNSKVKSMVDFTAAKKADAVMNAANRSWSMGLFVAGLLPMLFCLVLKLING
jgi:hypothetical protein